MDNTWSRNNGEWTGIGAIIQEGKNGGSRFLCTETFYALVEELLPVGDSLMHCQYCTEVGIRNVLTTTDCDELKKDALRKHALANDHVAAVQAKAGRKDMQRAVAITVNKS